MCARCTPLLPHTLLPPVFCVYLSPFPYQKLSALTYAHVTATCALRACICRNHTNRTLSTNTAKHCAAQFGAMHSSQSEGGWRGAPGGMSVMQQAPVKSVQAFQYVVGCTLHTHGKKGKCCISHFTFKLAETHNFCITVHIVYRDLRKNKSDN